MKLLKWHPFIYLLSFMWWIYPFKMLKSCQVPVHCKPQRFELDCWSRNTYSHTPKNIFLINTFSFSIKKKSKIYITIHITIPKFGVSTIQQEHITSINSASKDIYNVIHYACLLFHAWMETNHGFHKHWK